MIAGVYRDEQLVSGKHGVRFVKKRNKKGGSSSNRFRRRRVEQARDAYDRACAVAEEIRALLEQLGRELWSSTVELTRQAPSDGQGSSAPGA